MHITYDKSKLSQQTKELVDIQELLFSQLEDYNLLLHCTCELKEMLTQGCDEDALWEKIKGRELLIEKLTVSKIHFDSFKEYHDIAGNESKFQIKGLLQIIRQLLVATVSLDTENVALMKHRIKDITFNLEKIKEGKCFVSNLKKHNNNTPSFVDVCG